LALFVVASASHAQIKAVLYNKSGKAMGAAVLDTKLKSDGILEMYMILKGSAGTLKISETFTASGMPIEQVVTGGPQGAPVKIDIKYGAASAKMTATGKDKSNSRTFPYPKGANVKERNNLWFVRRRPRVGEMDAYSDLDVQTMAWKAMTTKYAGDEKLKYHGKLVNAHKLVSNDYTTWLDDKGLPYRSENRKTNELLVRQ
jgi:hypothetical protein